MKNYTKETFKIYWRHVSKYKFIVLSISFSVIIGTVTNIVAPLFYKEFFDILASGGEIAGKAEALVQILIKILIVYLIGWVFWRVATFTNSFFQTKVMADLANTCFAYLHKHSVNFFNNNF